ncbi:hypothetical protein GCM10011507_29700 [Edaphobacter acidisoli]|uniref:Uncharacterized protein n=2 Tax=Edaphobacter acidisoli TaxID=2040573 RepID=A0A916W8D1_9BACT|nr:hypothetical protein GCM10011507_29700 [Edaphobacter acidisoli]
MPMTALVLALGIKLLGNRYLAVAYFKALLLLIPIEFAVYLAWLRMPADRMRRIAMVLLLLAPFTMTAFLASVINLAVEEGYSYAFLALAVAILFLAKELNTPLTILFALALDCLYLSKSSMAPAAMVLLFGFLMMQRRSRLRIIAVVLALAAPAGWAVYQHRASGRYAFGTSLDGINFHKGNNADFLDRYPPQDGGTLDKFDPDLNYGLSFKDEWSFNDYHFRAGIDYVLHHPEETMLGDLRKLDVLLVSVRKVGSTRLSGMRLLWETATLALFRLILWAAIASAIFTMFTPLGEYDPAWRPIAGTFLALVVACVLPYVLGFAFTRHASVLIFPASLFCCRMLAVAPK